jgi:hypothetical protein
VVIGKSRDDVQSTIKELIRIGNVIGLTMNSGKTKYIEVEREGMIITTSR